MKEPGSHQSFFSYIDRLTPLSAEEKSIIYQHSRINHFPKGHYLVRQGEICLYDYFVLKGCLRSFYIDPKGNEHTMMFATENWWITDLGSFINRSPAIYHIQCLEASEVIVIDLNQLNQLFTQIPKLERLFRLLFQNAYIAFEKRIVNRMSLSARDQYLNLQKQYPFLEQRVPQYMIASYLGITKEFLSKLRGELLLNP